MSVSGSHVGFLSPLVHVVSNFVGRVSPFGHFKEGVTLSIAVLCCVIRL